MQLVTWPYGRNSPWGTHNVMKRSSHTHFSGGYSSQLTVDYMQKAISCLPGTQRVWRLSGLAALIHTVNVTKRNKGKKLSTSGVEVSLNTEVRGENLILYVYGSQAKLSTLITILIITTWSHNSLTADVSKPFQFQRWGVCVCVCVCGGGGAGGWEGCIQCFGRPGVVLASRSANWLRLLEWFGPTLPSDYSAPGIYVLSPGGICFFFPICFQHLFNLSTSQPGWSGLSHTGA